MTEMFSMSMLMTTFMYGIINKFKMREKEGWGCYYHWLICKTWTVQAGQLLKCLPQTVTTTLNSSLSPQGDWRRYCNRKVVRKVVQKSLKKGNTG